jgi:chemotaxis protein methyltransferase CheR
VPESVPLSEPDLRRLADFLYRRTGMVFAESKRYYIQRRLDDRMLATSSASFEMYFGKLRSDVDGEVEQFINAFTVNETYFYREEHQLRCLSSALLPDRVLRKGPGASVRIWSAPCATGEEPYSIAIWLLQNWLQVDAYDVEIVGSDIDTRAVDFARAGVFGRRALARLPQEVIDKYFIALEDDLWRLSDDLRGSVRFTAANLIDQAQTRAHGRFDVIFCRNVLIYFDEGSRRVAAENLYEALEPGGFICLGHTESMSRISPLFEVARLADAIVYRRPAGGRT